MDILIPTLGRMTKPQQHTLRQLQEAKIPCTLVVQPHEEPQARNLHDSVEVLPPTIKGIAATRDYMVHEMPGDHVLMLDDDLHFAVRRDDDRTKFRQPEPEDLRSMVRALDEALQFSPHVAIGSREGGNRVTEPIVYNTRMMRVLGYRRSFLQKHLITFSPMEVMEDFHVTLQILRLGRDCTVLNNWVSNQAGGSAAPGGCSAFRTLELQEKNARKLAALHPGFVKVVQKQMKMAWDGKLRSDVMVQWKQARASGGRS